MMSAGMLPAGAGAPSSTAGGQVACPACLGAGSVPPEQAEEITEALGMGDQDAGMEGAESANAGAVSPTDASGAGSSADLSSAAPSPVISPGSGDTCPECGGEMAGGKCASCGYSTGNSPMQSAIAKHIGSQPEHSRPDAGKVYKQGIHAREHMRRKAPYGRP